MTRFFPILPLLALTACPAGRPADEGPHCEDTRTAIAFDEVTPLGFSANDKLAGVPLEEATRLLYADGVATDLTVGFAPAEGAYFVDSEAVYPEGGVTTDIAVMCEDRIEVEGMFVFATADGAFSESFASTLSASAESVSVHQELDLDGLNGSFDLAPYVQAEDYDALAAWIDVSFHDGASVGSISGQASGEEECTGDACSAWAESVAVGEWPVADE
ncbi:MAG: hypothetical protein ACK4YP_22400 [Myxococcota bacterium]